MTQLIYDSYDFFIFLLLEMNTAKNSRFQENKLPIFFFLFLFVSAVAVLIKKLTEKTDRAADVSTFLRSTKSTKTLANKDLFVCGLVRDSSKTVIKNLDDLRAIGSVFRSCRFILVENDSKDGTDRLLREWAKDKENVILISKKMDDELAPLLPKLEKDDNYMRSTRRFTKMAILRNIYMEKMEELIDPRVQTWAMIVDLDLHSIPVKETLQSLSNHADGQWDMICANGITSKCHTAGSICNFIRKDNGKLGRPYDTLATRLDKNELENSFNSKARDNAWLRHQTTVQNRLNKAKSPVKVSSCFGGIGVYKAEKIKGMRYTGEDCEHISLNKRLSSIEIIPDFNVYYD